MEQENASLEMERLRLKLIETQMALLQYQHRETSTKISDVEKSFARRTFEVGD